MIELLNAIALIAKALGLVVNTIDHAQGKSIVISRIEPIEGDMQDIVDQVMRDLDELESKP